MWTNSTARLLLVSAEHMGKVACVLASLAGSGAAWAQCGAVWDAPANRTLSPLKALADWDLDGAGPMPTTAIAIARDSGPLPTPLRLFVREDSRMVAFGPPLAIAGDDGGAGCLSLLAWQGGMYAATSVVVFNVANGLVRLASPTSAQWETVATVSNSIYTPYISALAQYNGDLIAVGRFGTIAGQNIVDVARWNGSTWSRLGISGFTPNQYVWATSAHVHAGDLYVGFESTFTSQVQVDGLSTVGLARWNGSGWSAPNASNAAPMPTVNDLTTWNSKLVVAANSFQGLQTWDGSQWTSIPLPTAVGAPVSVVARGGELHVAGTGAIAMWDGSTWAVNAGLRRRGVLHAFNDTVVHAGPITSSQSGLSIARPDSIVVNSGGAGWAELGVGEEFVVVKHVSALGGNVYVFGVQSTGAGAREGLFRRPAGSTQAWEYLGGSGASYNQGLIECNGVLLDNGGNVVIAGAISSMGGQAVSNVVRLVNGVASTVGGGLSRVNGVSVIDGIAYFATNFGVYAWDGADTFTLRPGSDNYFCWDVAQSHAGLSPMISRALPATAGMYRPNSDGQTWQLFWSMSSFTPYELESAGEGLFSVWRNNSNGQQRILRMSPIDATSTIANTSGGIFELSNTGPGRTLLAAGNFTSIEGRSAVGIAKWTLADGWGQFAAPLVGPVDRLAWDGVDQWAGNSTGDTRRLSAGPGRAAAMYRWTSNSQAPVVTTPPASQALCVGRVLRLSVEYAAVPYPDVRWRRNGVPLVDGPQASGAFVLGSATDRLSLYGFAASDAGAYDCTLTNACETVTSLAASVTLGECSCDSIDFNNDTSLFDPMDVDAFFSVFSEGPCIPVGATCNDIDFNNDGSLFDPCDIDVFLLVFSEGPCTSCGQ
jgi:hypothetical protein